MTGWKSRPSGRDPGRQRYEVGEREADGRRSGKDWRAGEGGEKKLK